MYVVIGANGYLGSYVIQAILKNTNEYIIGTSRNLSRVKQNDRIKWIYCDVQSDESVDELLSILRENDNIKLVYLSAYHHPDKVEQNQELAWDINITALSKFLIKASFVDKIFYASTDSVYGNSINNYHFVETDPLNPVNFYGHNKCAAEALVVHLGRNVVRFPFLISPSIIYKPHFYDEILKNIKAGIPFEMFVDSYRSSLSFENAGEFLIELMEKENVPQIVNICGDKDLSKYDVGLLIADMEGINPNLIIPVTIDQPQKGFTAKRATSTLMNNTLLKNILGFVKIDIFEKPIRKQDDYI